MAMFKWLIRRAQEKSLRDEVLALVGGELKADAEKRMLEIVAKAFAEIQPTLDAKVASQVEQKVVNEVRDRDIRLVFPAWGDIEQVVRWTMKWPALDSPLQGWIDTCSVSLNPRIMAAMNLPDVSIPLTILGFGVPESATLQFSFKREKYRETRIVQIVTGAMLKKWTMVPVFKPVVSDRIEIMPQDWDGSESWAEITVQYAGFWVDWLPNKR